MRDSNEQKFLSSCLLANKSASVVASANSCSLGNAITALARLLTCRPSGATQQQPSERACQRTSSAANGSCGDGQIPLQVRQQEQPEPVRERGRRSLADHLRPWPCAESHGVRNCQYRCALTHSHERERRLSHSAFDARESASQQFAWKW